jgi:hypothetical protein
MKLTIGLPYCNDYDGIYFTIQDIRKELLFNGREDLLNRIEFVIVEDNCDPNHSKCLKTLLQRDVVYHSSVRFKSLSTSQGPGKVKDLVIKESTGDFVLVMDCHVLLCPVIDIITKLFQFMEDNPDTEHLYSGPLVNNDLKGINTHFNNEWSGHMWGVWGRTWQCPCGFKFSVTSKDEDLVYISLVEQDKLVKCENCHFTFPTYKFSGYENKLRELGFKEYGKKSTDKPFEIYAQGTGLFFTKRDSWLGFNKYAVGFGGEECYIHTKYRQAGRKNICLPFLKWLHRFDRPEGLKYQITVDSRIRNYIMEFKELGISIDPIIQHFKDYPKIKMAALITEADYYYRQS